MLEVPTASGGTQQSDQYSKCFGVSGPTGAQVQRRKRGVKEKASCHTHPCKASAALHPSLGSATGHKCSVSLFKPGRRVTCERSGRRSHFIGESLARTLGKAANAHAQTHSVLGHRLFQAPDMTRAHQTLPDGLAGAAKTSAFMSATVT